MYKKSILTSVQRTSRKSMSGLGESPFTHILLIFFFLLLSGCAPVKKPERPRFFWPPPWTDLQPKIEFIDFYQTDHDVTIGAESWMTEAVFGKERPKRLFLRPANVASDGDGRVFVTDIELHKVLILDTARHQIRDLADSDGSLFNVSFPSGLEVDGRGGLFVSDSYGHTIYRFGADEQYQYQFGTDHLTRPTGLAINPEKQLLYVVDTEEHRVAVFDMDGSFRTYLGEYGSGDGEFNYPIDVDVGPDGALYVLDALNARVQVFDSEGVFLHAFGTRGTGQGAFQLPKSISVSPSGHVYITDSRSSHFLIFDREGNHLMSVGGRFVAVGPGVEPGGFYLPAGIDVDKAEAIWVVDSMNRIVQRFQYLSPDYLEKHPILPGQAFVPPGHE